MFALIDCNNFFVSCERVFNPKLIGKPVVVLSNNDGCAIARSNEAKEVGVKMGDPLFKFKELKLRHDITTLSSNFSLYADMSQRVFQTLQTFGFPIEVYSIDEAFLLLPSDFGEDLQVLAIEIRQKVEKWTGIPVSVGIAKTKTLTKVANHYVKRTPNMKGTFVLDSPEKWLTNFEVSNIWGIGRKYSEKLNGMGIRYAHQLIKQDDLWIKKQLTALGLQTVYELRGQSCHSLNIEPETRKSFLCSRSLKIPTAKEDLLRSKAAHFIAKLCAKLRKHKLKASYITLFMSSSRFEKEKSISLSTYRLLNEASNYTPIFLQWVDQMFTEIHNPRILYKRIGVMVAEISSNSAHQLSFNGSTKENPALMKIVDQINNRYERGSIHFASEGVTPSLRSSQENLSSKFTTDWNELLTINLD
ncbi:MAG: Y-family DNA polymerase [Rhabdochlamydiaceae bacterium]|nr:Y-family DNA polymerase [Candidatus Amphrikana amoebophyrae]